MFVVECESPCEARFFVTRRGAIVRHGRVAQSSRRGARASGGTRRAKGEGTPSRLAIWRRCGTTRGLVDRRTERAELDAPRDMDGARKGPDESCADAPRSTARGRAPRHPRRRAARAGRAQTAGRIYRARRSASRSGAELERERRPGARARRRGARGGRRTAPIAARPRPPKLGQEPAVFARGVRRRARVGSRLVDPCGSRWLSPSRASDGASARAESGDASCVPSMA